MKCSGLSIRKYAFPGIGLITIVCLIGACDADLPLPENDNYILELPVGFPLPKIPDDNPLTQSKIDLGRQLFFDPLLSIDSSIACASCHKTEFAFADDKIISPGVDGRLGFRNAPTLANIAYAPYMMMDGGAPGLEQQVYVPLEDFHEMAFNMVLLIERLRNNTYYQSAFQEVFNNEPDAFGITRALASYQRTLISGNSSFDKYYYQKNYSALTASELRGMELFYSDELSCSKCHTGFNFTNYAFENTGLYSDYGADSGRARITRKPEDADKFKVPTLRNITLTAPYMHDGSKGTLMDVIEHYNSGGADHPNKSSLIKPLYLSSEQKTDLLNFLYTLTDNDFTHL